MARSTRSRLLEKLLVPLLCKLSNLVADGGIWLNTQRPEWNDANNALVGQGLSMVTLYYLRRYLKFMQELLASESGQVSLSAEVSVWLAETADALRKLRGQLGEGPVGGEVRYATLVTLGESASRYRERLYQQESFSGIVSEDLGKIKSLCEDALAAADHSIRGNRRDDGLYHAYNLLELAPNSASIDTLYAMLEGQVAALSSGGVTPEQAVEVIEGLFESDLYRADQHSFLLYPDRHLPGFLEKNRLPGEQVEAIALLTQMLEKGDHRLVERDTDGCYRFNSALSNVGALDARLDALAADYADATETARQPLRKLYEQVFNHKAFTGRSGGMFAFEGLGSIYWHMVSKLLVAVQECFFSAQDQGADQATRQRLGQLYYRVRKGIGFNKSPAEYGAFPTDPYSHTPKHLGAQQPGMTGQVKEEILTRFGELGVRISGGAVQFQPMLLRAREFTAKAKTFRFVDVDDQWQELEVPASGLAFSWCQLPVVYRLDDSAKPALTVTWDSGKSETLSTLSLPADQASEIFQRSGRILKLEVTLNSTLLFSEPA